MSNEKVPEIRRNYQCICCKPPRPIIIRWTGNLSAALHKDDESVAVRNE